METSPPRLLGLSALLLVCLLGLGGGAFGISRLAQADLDSSLILWFLLPLVGIPIAAAAGYQLYGLATARYRIDREGFALRWGLAFEQAPLQEVSGATEVAGLVDVPRSSLWRRVVGFAGTSLPLPGQGQAEIFGTGQLRDGVLVDLGNKLIIITPADRDAFLDEFHTSTRRGSLEDLQARSWRPDLVLGSVWRDWAARTLLIVGTLLPPGMIVHLSLRAGSIPERVPFGFGAEGVPGPLAPAGRLLLLPMIGLFVWVIDAVVGALLYRRILKRPLAYAIWSTGIVTSGLMWLAILQMLPTG